jgi:ribosomal protein S18 acetylase RimI-like enzyme
MPCSKASSGLLRMSVFLSSAVFVLSAIQAAMSKVTQTPASGLPVGNGFMLRPAAKDDAHQIVELCDLACGGDLLKAYRERYGERAMSRLAHLARSDASFLSWTQVIVACKETDPLEICGLMTWFNPKTLMASGARIVPPWDFESDKAMIELANGQHRGGIFYIPYLAIKQQFRNRTLAKQLKNAVMREYRACGLSAAFLLVLESNRAKSLYLSWEFSDTGESMPYGRGDKLLMFKCAGSEFRPASASRGSGRA